MCIMCEIEKKLSQEAVTSAGTEMLRRVADEGVDLPTAAAAMKAELVGIIANAGMGQEELAEAQGFVDQAAAVLANAADRMRRMTDGLFPTIPDTAEGVEK